ncbi:Sister chromatid cohesion protein PDS5-like protein [Capsicum annuum]|nr:Sister chromatid cohesion protein PDS5-like protein [Capsicum annuum]
MISLYKNKGDIQSCNNSRNIKLLSHTIKIWERVDERRLRKIVSILENQFGFISGRLMTEAINLGNGEIGEDVSHRIGERWMKWRLSSRILCDRKIQPSVDSGIVAVSARIKVMERRAQLDNLDIVEQIISNQTPGANDMENLWEYINNDNEEDVKRLEEWLDLVDLKLNHKLMMLENGAASSTKSPPNNAYQAYSDF